eukprot:553907-Prorocentrum_minimum.AAC.4
MQTSVKHSETQNIQACRFGRGWCVSEASVHWISRSHLGCPLLTHLRVYRKSGLNKGAWTDFLCLISGSRRENYLWRQLKNLGRVKFCN